MKKTIVLPLSGRGRPFLERLRAQEEKDEVMQALDEYRKPRDALLILVSDYVKICAPRLEELGEAFPARHTIPELLDSISVNVRLIPYLLERFSNDCRKTKTKVITPTNHNRSRQRDEPITIPNNYL